MRGVISQRHIPASPSMAMEKGAYQIQNQLGSPSKSRGSYLQIRRDQLSVYDRKMAAIIMLVVFAMAISFGSAFYLFKTGWVAHSPQPQAAVSNSLARSVKVIEFDRELGSAPVDESTKYLSYLSHSGFHNQRIAFENALIMARILNRTLLVPPVRLGKGTLTYYPFDHLYELTALSGKEGLGHCTDVDSWKTLPVECTDYYDYTLVPWNWLSNISAITSDQPILQRWNMTDTWLTEQLKIAANETFTIKDTRPYQFRFVDADPLDMPSSRFEEMVSMALLAQLPYRHIQIGTLFGSSRLRLRRHRNLDHRTQIRQSMAFTNGILHDLADSIKANMGGEYVAAHIRLGDGTFERKAENNVRTIWWKLLREGLNIGEEVTLLLERQISNSSIQLPPTMTPDLASIRTPHPPLPLLPSTILPRLTCRQPWHQDPRFSPLNTPLFISTDIPNAPSHPLLRRFFETFPCTFILSDFVDEVEELGRLKSGYDGLMLKDFITPFLDAVVAGKGYQLYGTDGSTFSQFVQDVLWRQYKGWDIVQRG